MQPVLVIGDVSGVDGLDLAAAAELHPEHVNPPRRARLSSR
jgi:hypothetical protein